jgi:hypothetical protein
MKCKCKIAVAFLLILVMLVPLSLSCGGGGSGGGAATITLGELSDFTGPASPAIRTLHYAVQDIVRYYNEEGLIPGVKIKLESWDTKTDSSREVIGYEWVRGRGAKVVITVMPQTGVMLKSFADRDKVPVCSLSTNEAMLQPPGWVFAFSNALGMEMKTLMKWLSEEHWDYAHGIPKIGFVGWSEPGGVEVEEAMAEYCQANPDKFEYVGGFLLPMGAVTFDAAVAKLKNCDYIQAMGYPMALFIKQFTESGYSATFIDAGQALSWRGFLANICGWEKIDGLLTASVSLMWGKSSPIVDLAEGLLHGYRSGEAEDVVKTGNAYVGSFQQLVNIFQILAKAIENVGAENFDGQAFYNAAVEYKTGGPMWEGYPQWGFNQTKRYLVDHVTVYKFDAASEDVVRLTDWLPLMVD